MKKIMYNEIGREITDDKIIRKIIRFGKRKWSELSESGKKFWNEIPGGHQRFGYKIWKLYQEVNNIQIMFPDHPLDYLENDLEYTLCSIIADSIFCDEWEEIMELWDRFG